MPLTAVRRVLLAGGCQRGMFTGGFLRRDRHEIANDVVLCEGLLRGGDLAKRPGRTKRRPELISFDIADQVWECRLVPCGGANQPDILQIHVPHVDNDDRACDYI